MTKAIYFDMDGTIADFYGVDGWLDCLMNNDVKPYAIARPLVNMRVLARRLNKLQREGWHIGIVSWLSKCGNEVFNTETAVVKMKWLHKHLPSVQWDEYNFLNYGTPKHERVMYADGILFDDEERNRENWSGIAYEETHIFEVLKTL